MLTVSTVNVNGIRAAYRRGMGEWLAARDPQILLLQEVRASDEILADHLGPDWHLVHRAGAAKGRNGVAIASRFPLAAVRSGLGQGNVEPEDQIGRWVEADLDPPGGEPMTVASVYIQDRKSTRLNSSHVAISYAVFCLKKKKCAHRLHSYLTS